jgi:hypothetical protein
MGRGKLAQRIIGQPRNMDGHMASHRPAGAAVPPQEMTMPLSVVTVTADYTSVEEATPLYTGWHGPVAATGTGEWDQIHAAGR